MKMSLGLKDVRGWLALAIGVYVWIPKPGGTLGVINLTTDAILIPFGLWLAFGNVRWPWSRRA